MPNFVVVSNRPVVLMNPRWQQIFTWFGNHAGSNRGLKIPGFNDNVTFDSVVNSNMRDEIKEEAKRLAGGVEDQRQWLPHYQTAKKTVKAQLTEEERKSFEDKVEDWNKNGIPSDVQGELVTVSSRKSTRPRPTKI